MSLTGCDCQKKSYEKSTDEKTARIIQLLLWRADTEMEDDKEREREREREREKERERERERGAHKMAAADFSHF